MLRPTIAAIFTLSALFVAAIPACGGHVVLDGSGGSTTPSTTASSSSVSTSSGTTGSGGCDPDQCAGGLTCCDGECFYLDNDIFNCGSCGHKCAGDPPYCNAGTCGEPPCTTFGCSPGEFCCGTDCCSAGQLCCRVPGPIAMEFPTCQEPVNGTCPVGCLECACASPDTPVATPSGDRPIAEIAVGDLVYSVDHDAVVAVPVLRVHRTPVHDHHVVRVTLAGGAVLEVSPRHPTADGRTFGDLRAGGTLDRETITSVEVAPYAYPFTYDILPGSATHAYFAAGALIGTTLAP